MHVDDAHCKIYVAIVLYRCGYKQVLQVIKDTYNYVPTVHDSYYKNVGECGLGKGPFYVGGCGLGTILQFVYSFNCCT